MIAVLDYGIGNLRSAEKALIYLGADARLVSSVDEAAGACGVVLPGVGGFGACARALRDHGLDEVALQAIEQDLPFLGICVGFQLLFESSEETSNARGLSVFKGTVARLEGRKKLPQMQWNTVERRGDPKMFPHGSSDPWFYFVHSYAPVVDPSALGDVAGVCDYEGPVTVAIEKGSCWGVQFHPEKSGANGLELLGRFVKRCTIGQAGNKQLVLSA
jgi:glutamine amidotransferase